MKSLGKGTRIDIVKGNVTDYATSVAENNEIGVEDLIKVLLEIIENLKLN